MGMLQAVAWGTEVKSENVASQRVSRSIGFVNVRDDHSAMYFEYLLI
jgi:hypothetical protein